MPSGYSGQLAVRYFGMVEDALEEAHAVIERTPTHIEGVQRAVIITTYAFKGEHFPSQQSEFLSLIRNEDGGLALSFTQFGNQPWGISSSVHHLLNDSMWNQREIIFSDVLVGDALQIEERLRRIIGAEYANRYDVDVANIFLNGLFAYGPNIMRSLSSYIPIVGKPLGTALTAESVGGNLHNMINAWISGYTQSQLESLEKLGNLNSTLLNWSLSSFADEFSLNGVIVSEAGSVLPQVSLFPTTNTRDGLANLDNLLNNSSINIDEVTVNFNAEHGTNFQLGSPSDIGDIFDNLPLLNYVFWELVNGGYTAG